MCRGPLAYGHATATRIFLGGTGSGTGANDRESFPSHPAGAEARRSDPEAGYLKEKTADWLPSHFNPASYKSKRRRYFTSPRK